jgi:hypothetical protein
VGDLIYQGAVSARLRYEPGSPVFTPLKNSGGQIVVRISPDGIRVRAEGGLAPWLARLLGANMVLAPSAVEKRVEQVTVQFGLSETPYVVLRARKRRRTMSLALRPEDGDLLGLEHALTQAGVGDA